MFIVLKFINGKLYIGSARDLHLRLSEHIANKNPNAALQKTIAKYAFNKFSFGVVKLFVYNNKAVSHKSSTDLETNYIKRYSFDNLYNFMQTATSLLGYKHTDKV